MGPRKTFLPFSGPKKQVRNYFPVEQGIPGAQTGMGLPENPDAIANAIPNNTTTNPSMILAFT